MKKCLLKYNFFHSFGSVLHFDQIIFIVIKENKKFCSASRAQHYREGFLRCKLHSPSPPDHFLQSYAISLIEFLMKICEFLPRAICD